MIGRVYEMKKKIIVIQSCIIAFLVVLLTILIANPKNISEHLIRKPYVQTQIFVEFGEAFSGFELTTYDGTTIKELPKGKVSAVMYLSDTCSSCMDVLADFNRFREVFGDILNYSIIWTDSIPHSLIDKYKIDSTINYSLSGKTRLSTSTPTFYILDGNNQIVFRDIERINLIKKLIELDVVDVSILQKNATMYIAKEYYGINDIEEFDKKLVYFYMPGCPDCEKVDALFEENSLSEFELLYIYKYDSVEPDKIIDKDKLFASVYEITWYPSFLVAKQGSVRVIGEMPIEQLIDEIAK